MALSWLREAGSSLSSSLNWKEQSEPFFHLCGDCLNIDLRQLSFAKLRHEAEKISKVLGKAGGDRHTEA